MTKRQFLVTAATTTAALCTWEPFFPVAHAALPARRRLSLNGAWQLAQEGTTEWLPATVPGCVHTDLMAARKIPDPYFRDNEKAVQWVGEANWVYRRSFTVPADILAQDEVRLVCEGLDTLAQLRINGHPVGHTDNMFRTWEFDVKPVLQDGENRIEVTFTSPFPTIKENQARRVLYEWAGELEPKGRAWVRKEPCNFGWDWGPVLVTCGIWRHIQLEAFSHARLSDLQVLQNHTQSKVSLEVLVGAEVVSVSPLPRSSSKGQSTGTDYSAFITIHHQGRKVASATVPFTDDQGTSRAHARLELKNPKLWWPAGMGAQPLYEVRVELLGRKNKVLDRTARRIGLRTMRLLDPDKDNSLRFEVNGVVFFSKGANYIPADAFANRVTPEILRRYVADAIAVNMNTLRFWGGGYYEEDELFDACDEMGVCVWMDFKFACSSYPAFDEPFMESVKQEARDNLRRLRHHPCIAVWCGNNEIGLMVKDQWSEKSMGRADYDKLFKHWLGQQVKDVAPQANYVSGSPDCGDTHYWEVWHGGKTFDAYRSFTGFASEFGFQSFPEPKTVWSYTDQEDRASLLTPVMQWHQRSPKGNEKIRDMIPKYFKEPKDFSTALWLSQIVQAYGIKVGAEYWRQTMPKSMACVYWQYNDCWPVASWSSVDYYGRWKALHYLARRFYAPILVSGLEDPKTKTIQVFVSSDRMDSCSGTLTWELTDVEGRRLDGDSTQIQIPARQSRMIRALDLAKQVDTQGAANVIAWLKLVVGGKVVSENMITLVAPKELALADPHLQVSIRRAGKSFRVKIKADKPALWTWLSLNIADAKCSDNFFHLPANGVAEIVVTPNRPMSGSEFAKNLIVRSLIDTYQLGQAPAAGNS